MSLELLGSSAQVLQQKALYSLRPDRRSTKLPTVVPAALIPLLPAIRVIGIGSKSNRESTCKG